MLLPDGEWSVAYSLSGSTWTGLPAGGQLLAEVRVGPDVARTFDLKLLDVVGTLTQGRVPLAEPAAGKTRGSVFLSGWHGHAQAAIASIGASSWTVRLYPGIYDVLYVCDGTTCDPAAMGPTRYLFYGMELR